MQMYWYYPETKSFPQELTKLAIDAVSLLYIVMVIVSKLETDNTTVEDKA